MDALRKDGAGAVRFEMSQNYQQVYRTVLDHGRRCWRDFTIVQGDLFTDIKTGNIQVAGTGYPPMVLLGIDLLALDDAKTEVRAYYANSHWEQYAKAIEKRVRGESQGCS